jgi:maltooligosyltrehalose trehalohydrolase
VRRPLTLIAESDLNDPKLIMPREIGGYGLAAQWNDDFHHVIHVALTGETDGYYADFGPMSAIAKVLTDAFFHNGTFSSFRGRDHGRPVDTLRTPSWRFIGYSQDHDQIGNRATGDRLTATLPPADLAIAAVLVLTGPFTPMLFMGEEWAAGTPWQFFTSHPERELAAAVAGGRRREFAAHGWPEADVPDPQAPETFVRSKLDWSEPDEPAHRDMLGLYRRLIALRKTVSDLSDPWLDKVDVSYGDAFLIVRRGSCTVVANLASRRQRISVPSRGASILLATERGLTLNRDGVELPAESAAVIGYR